MSKAFKFSQTELDGQLFWVVEEQPRPANEFDRVAIHENLISLANLNTLYLAALRQNESEDLLNHLQRVIRRANLAYLETILHNDPTFLQEETEERTYWHVAFSERESHRFIAAQVYPLTLEHFSIDQLKVLLEKAKQETPPNDPLVTYMQVMIVALEAEGDRAYVFRWDEDQQLAINTRGKIEQGVPYTTVTAANHTLGQLTDYIEAASRQGEPDVTRIITYLQGECDKRRAM